MLGFSLIRVSGDSMEPSLPNGSFALFRPVFTPRVGKTVLVEHDAFGLIIKRIVATSNDAITIAGTDPRSTSSEKLGSIKKNQIKGALLLRFAG